MRSRRYRGHVNRTEISRWNEVDQPETVDGLLPGLLEVVMSHGKICYFEIPAKTAEASAQFYSSIFGWKVRTRGDGELAFDDPAGVSGTWVKESDRTPDEKTRVYIMVDAIAETLSKIKAAGGRTITPRTEIGPGMGAFAVFADPVGNEFGLYEEPRR